MGPVDVLDGNEGVELARADLLRTADVQVDCYACGDARAESEERDRVVPRAAVESVAAQAVGKEVVAPTAGQVVVARTKPAEKAVVRIVADQPVAEVVRSVEVLDRTQGDDAGAGVLGTDYVEIDRHAMSELLDRGQRDGG